MLTHTIVSYPDRGPWGDNRYRGNTSGHLIKDLIETFGVGSVMDPMEGSGTTGDVCRDLNIPYAGFDLRDGYDILNVKSQQKMRQQVKEINPKGVDMIFFHPPYWNMLHYGDNMADFCNGPYSLYINRMGAALKWLRSCLNENGFIALLIADLRRAYSDRTYFLEEDTTTPIILRGAGLVKEVKIIKIQHKTVSNGVTNHQLRFAHEYCTILRNVSAKLAVQLEDGEPNPEAGGLP